MDPIYLDRNENRYGPAPECREVLRRAPAEILFNYTRDFTRGYYSALSQRLADVHGIDERRVVLGYGAEDLLKQAVQHGLRPGERCFLPSASWWYYRAIVDDADAVTVEFPIVEGATSFTYDVDALEDLHRERRARILILSTPNNPTGNPFPRDRLRAVLDHFRDATVVLDEAYLGFEDEGSSGGDDAASLLEDHPNLMILRTFSKLYALAGARIGYALLGRGLASFQRFSSRNLGFSRLSERLAIAALDDPGYYEEIRRRIVHDRNRILGVLRGFDGVRAFDSQANFILARFPESVVAPLQSALLRRGLVAKFFTEPRFTSCARITIGTEAESSKLIEALRQLLPALLAAPMRGERVA